MDNWPFYHYFLFLSFVELCFFSKIQFICYQHYLSFCLNMYIKAFICLKLICLHKSCLLPSPRLSIFPFYLEYLGFFLTSTDMINLNLPLLRLFSFLNPAFNYLFLPTICMFLIILFIHIIDLFMQLFFWIWVSRGNMFSSQSTFK